MKPLCIDLFCGLGGWADGNKGNAQRIIAPRAIEKPLKTLTLKETNKTEEIVARYQAFLEYWPDARLFCDQGRFWVGVFEFTVLTRRETLGRASDPIEAYYALIASAEKKRAA